MEVSINQIKLQPKEISSLLKMMIKNIFNLIRESKEYKKRKRNNKLIVL
jgi:hypothetical protein